MAYDMDNPPLSTDVLMRGHGLTEVLSRDRCFRRCRSAGFGSRPAVTERDGEGVDHWFPASRRVRCEAVVPGPGLRRQGFHEWVAGEVAREATATRERVAVIASIHAEHRPAYGVPRITAELRRRGRVVNHKRVERLMRGQGLAGITRRKRRSLTTPAARCPRWWM
ncbi:hypothetical protein DMC63_35760 [Streptomyces sp. WAC 05977]|nr:hypothetical protein DMC63_35760 [Streptomyces sp. WAC 05977]